MAGEVKTYCAGIVSAAGSCLTYTFSVACTMLMRDALSDLAQDAVRFLVGVTMATTVLAFERRLPWSVEKGNIKWLVVTMVTFVGMNVTFYNHFLKSVSILTALGLRTGGVLVGVFLLSQILVKKYVDWSKAVIVAGCLIGATLLLLSQFVSVKLSDSNRLTGFRNSSETTGENPPIFWIKGNEMNKTLEHGVFLPNASTLVNPADCALQTPEGDALWEPGATGASEISATTDTAVAVGFVLLSAAFFAVMSVTVAATDLQREGAVVPLFWANALGFVSFATATLVFDDITIPHNWRDVLLCLAQAVLSTCSFFLKLLALVRVDVNLVSVIDSARIPTGLLLQETLLSAVTPEHNPWFLACGSIVIFTCSVAGPVYEFVKLRRSSSEETSLLLLRGEKKSSVR